MDRREHSTGSAARSMQLPQSLQDNCTSSPARQAAAPGHRPLLAWLLVCFETHSWQGGLGNTAFLLSWGDSGMGSTAKGLAHSWEGQPLRLTLQATYFGL